MKDSSVDGWKAAGDEKRVSILRRLLLDLPTDNIIDALYRLDVAWTWRVDPGGITRCRIKGDGTLVYESSSQPPRQPKVALVDAFARFLTEEQRDYHALLRTGETGE